MIPQQNSLAVHTCKQISIFEKSATTRVLHTASMSHNELVKQEILLKVIEAKNNVKHLLGPIFCFQ